MPAISAFDMLKIGVGPSSSHTLGPWRAVERWIREHSPRYSDRGIDGIEVDLFGSLALTGKGHATDKAIALALLGADPQSVDTRQIPALLEALRLRGSVELFGRAVAFDVDKHIQFHREARLPGHANGMVIRASSQGQWEAATYYSIGGGFVIAEGEQEGSGSSRPPRRPLPYPCETGEQMLRHCRKEGMSIAQMVRANEACWRDRDEVRSSMLRVWEVMVDAAFRGCHTSGVLPGGLDVARRAYRMHQDLLPPAEGGAEDPFSWLERIRSGTYSNSELFRWISCFALAVNEENAALGRVVTAPTNGAAGVIPAVLLYHVCFGPAEVDEKEIVDFLLVAADIGSIFKKRATISAAMGGCQAEIGVSSAMAAGALTEARGGTPAQALMAAEIAMEHHLGLTCDPVGGLVQIPCIERNTMGAVKAISASELALVSRPEEAKVSFDQVIETMWATARDMHEKYKETSSGGLAVSIPVNLSEC